MATNYPLLLLLNCDSKTAIRRISKLIANDPLVHIYCDSLPAGPSWRVIYKGISFGFQVGSVPAHVAEYDAIFCSLDPSVSITGFSVGLDANVNGGERTAPIAASLLGLGAYLCKAVSPVAVAWNPGAIITDPAFFAEAVHDYVDGGVFPALAVIGFAFSSDDEVVRTSGLSWFSGQELELRGKDLGRADLARRAVRLIHDIAVNGPIAAEQIVPDLTSGQRLILTPSEDKSSVVGQIATESDAIR